MTRRSLIVDGYNVLRSTPRYSTYADRDLESARARLVADVAAFAKGGDWDAHVVFDGALNPDSTGEAHEAVGIQVVFSAYGRDADSAIEDMASRCVSAGRDVTVVTSDAETQWVVMGQGATRMSSAEFVSELGDAEVDWRAANPSGSKSVTLDRLLDDATRRALSRWARGEH
ncbi:MAG: NYN domain-containing protein [Actinomycetota bacterium]|nr:NYN domain-containing protein [Actinomycetota bacterium]